MNLRRYRSEVVMSRAGRLRRQFERGDLTWIDLALSMSELKFRDDGRDYWFLDARAGRWYRFGDAVWRPAAEPPAVLEGAASLSGDRASLPRAWTPDEDLQPGSAERSTVEALEEVTRTVRSAYDAGELSSQEAERMLGRYAIVDEQGRVWAVGARSGQWYAFEEGAWREAEAGPAEDSLVRMETVAACQACAADVAGHDVCPACGAETDLILPEVSDAAYAGMLDLLLLGGALPEPVTEPWAPPTGFPQEVASGGVPAAGAACPACGASVGPAKRFCTQCGAPLDREGGGG